MEDHTVRDSPDRKAICSPVRVPGMYCGDPLTEYVPV